jgi:hypothetical protein
MDIKRAPLKTLHRLERTGKACARAWNERAEDGRTRYATAGFGLGLIVGSLLSAVAHSLGLSRSVFDGGRFCGFPIFL